MSRSITKYVTKIPTKIFNIAKSKSGEYRNIKEYNNYVNHVLKNDPFLKDVLLVIKSEQLTPLFAWGNGDYCFYSFKDGKLYDFNHETGLFEKSQLVIKN